MLGRLERVHRRKLRRCTPIVAVLSNRCARLCPVVRGKLRAPGVDRVGRRGRESFEHCACRGGGVGGQLGLCVGDVIGGSPVPCRLEEGFEHGLAGNQSLRRPGAFARLGRLRPASVCTQHAVATDAGISSSHASIQTLQLCRHTGCDSTAWSGRMGCT